MEGEIERVGEEREKESIREAKKKCTRPKSQIIQRMRKQEMKKHKKSARHEKGWEEIIMRKKGTER